MVELSAMVWTVRVVDPSDDEPCDHFHVFSTEAAAVSFAGWRPEACVVSSYVVDHPELYYERPQ